MLNHAVSCSRVCSVLFHERSVNVLFHRTCLIHCAAIDTCIFLDVCSVCSGVLYPSVSCSCVFSEFCFVDGSLIFLPAGMKVTEQNEQSLVKHSLYLTQHSLQPVPTNRTLTEQNQNTVRNRSEQTAELVKNHQPSDTNTVPLSVLSCSGLFGLNPNTVNPELPRLAGLFLQPVRFVRYFLTPLLENLMTRLPRTQAQTAGDQRKAQLIRYLIRQSEERQVMFLRSLSDNNLRFDLQNQLAEHQRGQHHDPERDPEPKTEL